MKFDYIDVWGFEGAMRGMRNPKNSWDRGDTGWYDDTDLNEYNCGNECFDIDSGNVRFKGIGPNDRKLACQLIAAGPEHRKFLRYIHVQMDITAPLFWWKEYDTYKISTVANSTSTMHKITSQPITMDCFETDDMDELEKFCLNRVINDCEAYRQLYLETKDVKYWKALIRLLPESWLQTRTVDLNYETLRAMYHQRKNHKLTEWHSFCNVIEALPYADYFITDESVDKQN